MEKNYIVLLIVLLILGCSKDETILDPIKVEEVEEVERVNLPPNNFETEFSDISHNSATIQWNAAIDPENDAVTYDVYLNNELLIENISELTHQFIDLEELNGYTGKIIAKDPNNNKTEVTFSFQTEKYYLKFLKKYDYGEYQYGPGGYAYGNPTTMIKSNDQNYVITGASFFPNGSGYRLFILKIDYEGNELWKKFYDYDLVDGWNPKIINSATGFIVASHHHVLSLDNEGNIIWYKKIESYDIEDGSADIKSVAQDSEKNIFIVGGRGSSLPGIVQEGVITKLDSYGNLIWEKAFSPSIRTFFNDIIISSSNQLYVLGSSETNGATFPNSEVSEQIDFYVMKLSDEGEELWSKTYGDARYDFPERIIEKSNGNYVFAGYGWGAYDISKGRIFEIDPEGTELWNVTTGLSSTHSIAETFDGGFITVGHFSSGNYGALGIYKFSSSGIEEWNKLYQESFTYLRARSVVIEEDGGYRIAGYSGKNYYSDVEIPELLIYKTDPEGNYD